MSDDLPVVGLRIGDEIDIASLRYRLAFAQNGTVVFVPQTMSSREERRVLLVIKRNLTSAGDLPVSET